MNNNTNIKNSFFIITIFVLAGFLISGEFGIFDKLKTQIFNPNSQTKEYNWYFNFLEMMVNNLLQLKKHLFLISTVHIMLEIQRRR